MSKPYPMIWFDTDGCDSHGHSGRYTCSVADLAVSVNKYVDATTEEIADELTERIGEADSDFHSLNMLHLLMIHADSTRPVSGFDW